MKYFLLFVAIATLSLAITRPAYGEFIPPQTKAPDNTVDAGSRLYGELSIDPTVVANPLTKTE